jgi:hypothetical protein
MPLNDKQRATLARDLQRAIARVAPDWTDVGTHDPGITMLQLLAFTLDALQYRHAALAPHARLLARDVATRAAALAAALDGTSDDCGGGLARVNYFTGMVLGSDDFSAEQDYLRHRLNRLNRLLHGSGVVTGLAVGVAGTGSAGSVTIAPGFALDRAGNEICVDVPCTLALPTTGTALLVLLSYREQPCRSVPATSGPLDPTGDPGSSARATRIAETFDATLAALPVADAVALARVVRVRGRWRVDPAFKTPRVGR